MQCRYCFGDEEPETMVSPCRCRGSSEFTHRVCFDRYIDYFPDRICRVCHSQMGFVSVYDRMLPHLVLPLLISAIALSSAAPPAKIILTLVGLGLSAVFALHPIFTRDMATASVLLGTVLLYTQPQHGLTVWVMVSLGGAALFYTLVRYIDPVLLLMIAMSCGAIIYAVVFAISLLQYLDRLSTAILVIQMFLVWSSVLRLRPGRWQNPVPLQ